MTKKKQRTKLARVIRQHGVKGARAFQIARAILQADAPHLVPQGVQDRLDLWIDGGHVCPHRHKLIQPVLVCGVTFTDITAAWLQFLG